MTKNETVAEEELPNPRTISPEQWDALEEANQFHERLVVKRKERRKRLGLPNPPKEQE